MSNNTVRETVLADSLLQKIRLRQRRLGTPTEATDDFDEICHLAHLLSNVRTVQILSRELREQDQAVRPWRERNLRLVNSQGSRWPTGA